MTSASPVTVSADDNAALLSLAIRLAAEAADIINAIRERGFRTDIKSDASPVTEADHASEHHILTGLRAACPAIPAIGEEEASVGIRINGGDAYWLVDPLDGTRGFASGGRDFTVNIGLVRHDRPVLGVVALPGYGLIYSGGQGLGAHRSDGPHTTRISTATPPPEGLRVLASSHHGDPELLDRWLAGRKVASIDRLSSSVKFMRVAEGEADFYPRFGPTMEWDTAAPQAILEAAGGAILDENGKPLRYGKPGRLNGSFYCTGGAS
ncbi:3'(2'),5'-bisphosphate nucleotidase CysQ family protein [Gluconobacter kanchanaburiensis]|uniref:3'(2'),5'-bisphosphate nucleotidase CysQ n=1 Tax=Gluconobacter kanchanaburiensis NBRC 103587 TaxID=1307948 RepID=A0A511B5S3_9PROT|nr:3'(2'),5'-bisphosphate nucleotidase CysQ [Gluconobacter kanchanaburiensis]MBF0861446.1 3'(2'),5'-bisphosphate nucleotidase CysQ [Gluconobacter kanchanaburiensis]GBR68313.1 exopolysaccharide production protein [Gluconobacter kanchanaburiensis NBRC 103587]GEK95810.1 3'(2'),5'-bisphosphate nucleotidase CysQ [Gluconobacter kanchanaburiensis NBRC 103587]